MTESMTVLRKIPCSSVMLICCLIMFIETQHPFTSHLYHMISYLMYIPVRRGEGREMLYSLSANR